MRSSCVNNKFCRASGTLVSLTGLISIILAGDVITKHRAAWIPSKPLGELGLMVHPENIFISYQAPNAEGFSGTFFDHRNFRIWDKIFHGSTNNIGLVGSHHPRVLNLVFVWKRELKVFGNRNWQNIRCRAYSHVAGGSVSSIE